MQKQIFFSVLSKWDAVMKIFLEDFSTIDIFLQNMPFLFNLNFLPENVPFKKKTTKNTKPWANAN